MEDKKNTPVPEKDTKKPTGKSATGKPLDGIDVNPQLNDKRRTNEDFAVLTASLQERKALTLAQRQKRARQIKRIQPKLKRAKEISRARIAGPEKLERRAKAKALAFVKRRVAARKDIPYAELTTAEKIQVDTAVSKKTQLIKRIAARLLPKLRKAEFERLKSFHSGAQMKSLHTVASEDFSGLFNDLNEKSTLELVDIIENAISKFEREGNSLSITLRKMLNSTIGTDPITETLIKKSEKTGIPFSTLKEVFERGFLLYVEESNQTQEQIAFNRVNSYIAKGRAWKLDADLREEKVINEKLDSAFTKMLENNNMSNNDSSNREIGTDSLTKNYVENTPGQSVPVTKINRKKHEIVDRRGEANHVTKKRHQEIKKKIIDEGEMKPYVKPHIEKGSTKQSAWVASNKWGKKKYFGMDFKASAHKHAGISEETNNDLNENFNMAWTAGIGVTLSAEECGIVMKPAFELHPSVEEEVRSADTRGEIVPGYTKIKVDPKTGQQKTINVQAHIARGKVRRKIIGSGNVHDGAA